jgi:hypothetical protein
MGNSRPAGSTSPSADRTLQMSVANMTFMVDRLGSDCAPGQYIRELTENGIAAVEALGAGKNGEVIWDVDWNTHALTGRYKLCVIDTGIGMTGPEMVEYINKLSSSVHQQSNAGNFGVGAKVSAAPLNHEGLIYLSWKNGVGSMVHLWRDPVTDVYGLKQFARPDGTHDFWAHVDPAVKPEGIGDHGTMVVLLGMSEEQNTLEPPDGMPMPAKWILRYLNSRYFRFPASVTAKVREGWANPKGDKHNFLRVADGMAAWLQTSAESSSSVPLTGATAHWWILRSDADVNAGHYTPPPHTAALYQDELYEITQARSGVARLQSFGVIFGHQRVVIYIEPDAAKHRVESNTARTTLTIDGETLPWAEWAAEFRDKIPEAIRVLVEEVGAKAASSDHRQSIRERLRAILDLFKLTHYRPSKSGSLTMDPESVVAGGKSRPGGRIVERGSSDSPSGGRGGRAGSIYGLFLATDGKAAEEAAITGEPNRKWVSIKDGTRTKDDMEDKAAKYLAAQNLILINADFRVFTDMIAAWTKKYEHAPGAASVVQEVVREWFEQQLVEAVMGAKALRDSPEWTMDTLEKAWSQEALTAVVIPRYHVNHAISRGLGSRLGTLKDRVA